MKTSLLLCSLLLAAACGGHSTASTSPKCATGATGTQAAQPAMMIKWSTVYVDDQDKALKFYTDVLGFQVKDDYSNSGYRWLSVSSLEAPDAGEVVLESNANPIGKAYQAALNGAHLPATQFLVQDLQATYDRLVAKGVKFTMPVTDITMSKIAMLDDTCGNLIQLVELTR